MALPRRPLLLVLLAVAIAVSLAAAVLTEPEGTAAAAPPRIAAAHRAALPVDVRPEPERPPSPEEVAAFQQEVPK